MPFAFCQKIGFLEVIFPVTPEINQVLINLGRNQDKSGKIFCLLDALHYITHS